MNKGPTDRWRDRQFKNYKVDFWGHKNDFCNFSRNRVLIESQIEIFPMRSQIVSFCLEIIKLMTGPCSL